MTTICSTQPCHSSRLCRFDPQGPGLEYDSVKIVITDANEDDITHSIFYTAVYSDSGAPEDLWTPETQQAVLTSLQRAANHKDVALLSVRRGLIPVRMS